MPPRPLAAQQKICKICSLGGFEAGVVSNTALVMSFEGVGGVVVENVWLQFCRQFDASTIALRAPTRNFGDSSLARLAWPKRS